MDRVGSPHVHERHEPAFGHIVHDLDDGHRGAFSDQDVQLVGDRMEGGSSSRLADVICTCIRVDVHNRRSFGDLHGFDARGYLHPRHILHCRTHPLRAFRWEPIRDLRGDHLLVSKDVRTDDERANQ